MSALYRNKCLLGGLSLGILLQTAVVYSETLNRLFHTVPSPPQDYLYIVGGA